MMAQFLKSEYNCHWC